MHLDVKKIIKTIMQLGVVCMLLLIFSDVTQVSAARPKMVIDSRNKEDRNVRITVTATNLEEVDVAEFYYYDRKNRIHNLKISNIRKYRINKNTHALLLMDANSAQNKCIFDKWYCNSNGESDIHKR